MNRDWGTKKCLKNRKSCRPSPLKVLTLKSQSLKLNVSKSPSKQRPLTKQHPSTTLCPSQIVSPAAKRKLPAAALHTQKFVLVIWSWLQRPEVVHGSLNQLQMPFDPTWNAYGVPAFPRQASTVSLGQLSRVPCSDLCPVTHIYTHTQILFWHNGAKDDIFWQQLVAAVEKVGRTLWAYEYGVGFCGI